MKKIIPLLLAAVLVLVTVFVSGKNSDTAFSSEGKWAAGFASCQIDIPKSSSPLYIAGYKNGAEIAGVLDKQRASAVWLETDKKSGILLISVDCIALSSETVNEIRDLLKDFTEKTGCAAVNIFATHDHAGIDTLGLWGKVGYDGKNADFMRNLKSAAVSAAKSAYKNRKSGKLFYGEIATEKMQNDSRYPYTYSKTMHQFRFLPENGSKGIRMIIYSAHAEALGADNLFVSRDWPGVMADKIEESCGDDTLFINGAIGGLVTTAEQSKAPEENMRLTGERLAEYALKINDGTELSPKLSLKTKEFCVPLDNPTFMYYRFLGILGNKCVRGTSETGYEVETSLTVITLGEKTVLCLPCEIFPELVSSDTESEEDPEPLDSIALEKGIDGLIVAGLCNDEIGYVMPPSDFLTDSELPFIKRAADKSGESHYEETNSVGKDAAIWIANAFRLVLSE